ncbi:MAG TPA: ATP-binding protein [Capillimicrobium sp.]|jgi:anti-sigma regulatory factor (Ser/Thr protein kinase)
MDAVPHLRLHVPAVSGNVPLIRHALVAFAASQGATDDQQGSIALAITEAVANVVVHAYRDRAEPSTVTVEADADPEDGDLQIVIVDEGLGITARYESEGLGMGLGIIAGLANEFAIRDRRPRGTEVFLRFTLDGSPA